MIKEILNSKVLIMRFLVLLFLLSTPLTLADNWVGFQFMDNENILAYHSNGSILCSVLNNQRELIALKQIDHDSNPLWQYVLPDSYINGTVLFDFLDDESGYVMCGKQNSTHQYQVSVIDRHGSSIMNGCLSDSFFPIAVVDTGILFAEPYSSNTNSQTIYYSDWSGNQISGTFMGKVIYTQQSIYQKDYVYLSIVYENSVGQRIASILSFNLLDGLINHYDIGSELLWSIQTIETYNDNMIIVVCFENDKNRQMITLLNGACEAEWKVYVTSTLQFPVAQVITQASNGNIQIWGTACRSGKNIDTPYLETTYMLELDSTGSYKSDQLGTYAGNCVKYINNDIYVIDYDDTNYASLDTFHTDSRYTSPFFTVHRNIQ